MQRNYFYVSLMTVCLEQSQYKASKQISYAWQIIYVIIYAGRIYF